MAKLKVWHNPRCRKSRETVALLKERGVELEITLYLETPPDAAELGRVLDLLNLEPRQLMRRKEAPYKELNLAADHHSRDDLIAAMVAHPILIERPVVMNSTRAALGRPPENVLKLLDS